MKVHFKKSKIINSIPRKYYSDWIKPLFPTMRHKLYGLDKKDLILSKNIKDADILILPLTWNYYFENGKTNEAYKIINYYEKYNKPIITWVSGDYTHNVKEGNFFLLQHNLYKSRQKINEHAYPAIIRDPNDYLKTFGLSTSSKISRNNISFCGTANWRMFDKVENFVKEFIFKNKNKYFKSYLDLSMPTSGMILREKLLKALKKIQT